MLRSLPELQVEAGRGPLPKTRREAFAELLRTARRELDVARAAMEEDESPENEARFAHALFVFDRLQGAFPATLAGLTGDARA